VFRPNTLPKAAFPNRLVKPCGPFFFALHASHKHVWRPIAQQAPAAFAQPGRHVQGLQVPVKTCAMFTSERLPEEARTAPALIPGSECPPTRKPTSSHGRKCTSAHGPAAAPGWANGVVAQLLQPGSCCKQWLRWCENDKVQPLTKRCCDHLNMLNPKFLQTVSVGKLLPTSRAPPDKITWNRQQVALRAPERMPPCLLQAAGSWK